MRASLLIIVGLLSGCTEALNESGRTVTRSPQGIDDDLQVQRARARNREAQGERTQFRTYDGSGNNLDQLELGATFRPLRRTTPVGYTDGISSPAGPGLASARTISNLLMAQAPGNVPIHPDTQLPKRLIYHDLG